MTGRIWSGGERDGGGAGRQGPGAGERGERERGTDRTEKQKRKRKGEAASSGGKKNKIASLSPSDDDFRVKDTRGWKERRKKGETAEEEGGERQRRQGESRRGEGEAGEQSWCGKGRTEKQWLPMLFLLPPLFSLFPFARQVLN